MFNPWRCVFFIGPQTLDSLQEIRCIYGGSASAFVEYLFNQLAHGARGAAGRGAGLGAAQSGDRSGLADRIWDWWQDLTGSEPPKVQLVTRYMSQGEYDAMASTGLMRGGREGTAFATNDYYTTASDAQNRLALPSAPTIAATLAVQQGTFSSPSVVLGAYGYDGGGTERTAIGKIPVQILNTWKLK